MNTHDPNTGRPVVLPSGSQLLLVKSSYSPARLRTGQACWVSRATRARTTRIIARPAAWQASPKRRSPTRERKPWLRAGDAIDTGVPAVPRLEAIAVGSGRTPGRAQARRYDTAVASSRQST